MTASLPTFKVKKIHQLASNLTQQPCRKSLEKIFSALLWATSLVHHARFLLTSLYRVPPRLWEHFLDILNDDATITRTNRLHLPIGAKISEFRHPSITSKDQPPLGVPSEKHAWVRIRDPNTDKQKLAKESKSTLLWTLQSLLPLLSIIPLNRFCSLNIQAAADAFAIEDAMGIGAWVTIPTGSGSAKHARNQNLLSSLQSRKSFRDISHHGKLWPNYVSS